MEKQLSQLPVTLVGYFLYYCLPFRKKVIKHNINIVFKDSIREKTKKRLALAFYSHLATFLKEILLLSFKNSQRLQQQLDIQGIEHLLAAHKKGKGILLLSCHLGNWEFASILGLASLDLFKGRYHVIRKAVKTKRLETFLFQGYRKNGVNVICKKGAFKKIEHALAKNDAVIFALDQHTSVSGSWGIAVEFFGKKAGTYSSLAIFAQKTGSPVVPMVSYRLENGHHRIEFYPELSWQNHPDPQEEIYRNTYLYNQTLEELILAHPEQWLWSHRRWKI